jgi:hypothetical protein
MNDPQYIDAGNEFGEGSNKPPLNRTPTTDWQREVLAIFGMKYYKDRQQKSELRMIEKGMAPFAINPSRPPLYPTEYVTELLEWARKKRRTARIPLSALLSAIQNDAKRNEWVDQHLYKIKINPPEKEVTPTIGVLTIRRHGQEIVIDENGISQTTPTDQTD